MPRDINAPENQGDRPGMTAKNFEIKFDWQKNAPRDGHFNDMGEVRNSIFNHKPFGIEVRNVKCLKCGEWGHSNFDRVCPLFGKVGDRDNPEFDIAQEQLEILSTRLTENSYHGYKFKQGALQHVGDTLFDPSAEKKKHGELELEFLKTLEPAEKEALLARLEKERKKKKKMNKKNKLKARQEIKKELERTTIKQEAQTPLAQKEPDYKLEEEKYVPEITNIELPKMKADIEKAERIAAKKEFARKLAEFALMNQESDSDDSSDSDSSESDSDSDDSDYESKSASSSSPTQLELVDLKDVPESFKGKIMPPPKPGMVLVKRKRSQVDIEEEKAKKLKLEKLKMLEMTIVLRKKMEEKQKEELASQQRKVAAAKIKQQTKPCSSRSLVSDDLTSGLLDVITSDNKSTWSTKPLIAYDSSSDSD